MATIPDLTWQDLREGVHRLCKERGWHHGVPIMSETDPTRKVVLAKGAPLSDTHGPDVPIGFGTEVHVCANSDVDENVNFAVLNEWHQKPKEVIAYREGGKAKVATVDYSTMRFEVLIKSLLCGAGAVGVQAETHALISLASRINDNQFQAYLLVGAFPETSKRSGVTYILRKGLPTIAMRCIPRPQGDGEERRFLAALCIHPLGWFSGTHVGVCPPSDEVLSVLLMIRADEAKLWSRAHQLTIDDPMAAI